MHLSYGSVVHSYRGGTGYMCIFMSSLVPRPSARLPVLYRVSGNETSLCLPRVHYYVFLELVIQTSSVNKLGTRRNRQKLLLCNHIWRGYSILPPSFFIPHPFPHLRHNHPLPLYHPNCRSTAYLSSFSASVVPLWTLCT